MRPSLDNLVRILQEREALTTPSATGSTWTAIPGLELRRGVHEWVSRRPPTGFFAACCAANIGKSTGCVVWVGVEPRTVGHALARLGAPDQAGSLLDRSIFVMPPDDASRLWAIDLALRSPGAAMVVADGRGMGVHETRRLQLAAEAGLKGAVGGAGVGGDAGGGAGGGGGGWVGGGVALLARLWEERAEPSAAMTRWLIEPAPTSGRRARWRLELLRRKSSHPAISPECWFVEWDREEGAVVVPADVAGGPGAPARVEAEQPGPQHAPLRRTG